MKAFVSKTAEYALRATAWIAVNSPRDPVLTRELSARTQIPTQYLSKILRRLVLAEILESRKGRGGGFILTRPPERITFRDVLVAVDAYPREDQCAFGWGECDAAYPCPLHSSWTLMSGYFKNWAADSTFAARAGSPVRNAVAPRRKAAAVGKAIRPQRTRKR